jgi:molybdenum storage protein
MIYVKDEDGLYTAYPKKDSTSKYIPRIGVEKLLKLDLEDLIVERAALESMARARNICEIQFVNGLRPGQLTEALNGEPVGAIVLQEQRRE